MLVVMRFLAFGGILNPEDGGLEIVLTLERIKDMLILTKMRLVLCLLWIQQLEKIGGGRV